MKFFDEQTTQKLRGGYYTDLTVASFLTRWVSEISPRSILEPSSGDGVFLAALDQLQVNTVERVTACEIDSQAASKTSEYHALLPHVNLKVYNTDFLGWSLDQTWELEQFDAVVGNPPYVRYQYLTSIQQKRAGQIHKRAGLSFTRHTNAWVPFVVGSLAHLKPGGRLAMVIPAEIFHVPHAGTLREYLVRECSSILLIDPAELWFDGVLQGVTLLLAEKKCNAMESSRGVGIVRTTTQDFLRESAERLLRRANWANGDVIKGKWMRAFLTKLERDLLSEVCNSDSVRPFEEVADVDVGIVTGANRFFLVPDSVVDEFDLHEWAHPMFGRGSHVRGVIYDRDAHEANRLAGLPSNFLWFDKRPLQEYPPSVQRYIRAGELQGLHTRYKCRTRKPWYTVPSVFPAPAGMLKRCNHFPRLILNRHNALTTDTSYRIWLHKGVS